MKPKILYRVAAVLIILFDAGHTVGYPWSDPKWGVDLRLIQSTHFNVVGASRTYWDFYRGFGLYVTVFLFLAAVLSWQLGSLPGKDVPAMRATAWTLALCFGGVAILSWQYFFVIPLSFSIAVAACLTVAASMQSNQANGRD
ncbi:MAG: hypothetical protein ABI718_16010 [Acidobacteriota bacterium]